MGDDLSHTKKKHIWETHRHILLPYMNRRNVFGGGHMAPIWELPYWAPYMKRRKALSRQGLSFIYGV
jgi:hypothetical protein